MADEVGRFHATVRFDVTSRAVRISVGGLVEHQAVDELCDVIGRSVDIAGRRADVDLTDARLETRTLRAVSERCRDIATIRRPPTDPKGA